MTTPGEELQTYVDALSAAISEEKRIAEEEDKAQSRQSYLVAQGQIEDKNALQQLAEVNSRIMLFPAAAKKAQKQVRDTQALLHSKLRELTLKNREKCRRNVLKVETQLYSIVFGESPPRSREAKEAVINLAKCSFWQDWLRAFESIAHQSTSSVGPLQDLQDAETFLQWLPKFEAGKPRR